MATSYADALLHRVEFRLSSRLAPEAKRVCLSASFNQWAPDAHEMRKDPNGDWTLIIMLPPGVYKYLYYVDGAWCNDPCDDGRSLSGWGNQYSLKVVR